MKRIRDAGSFVQPLTGGELRWTSEDERLEATRFSEENVVNNPTGGRSRNDRFFLRHRAPDGVQPKGGIDVNAIPLHCL